MDDETLDKGQVHLLYEQLARWRDARYLIEALECENGAYERLKGRARRIERRNIAIKNARTSPEEKGKPTVRTLKKEDPGFKFKDISHQ